MGQDHYRGQNQFWKLHVIPSVNTFDWSIGHIIPYCQKS